MKPQGKRVSITDDCDSKPPLHPTVGKEYDATKILQRLKYLETIITSPGITPASLHEAQREKVSIFSHVAD